MSVSPGDVLAGKYCIERVLGEGGMGVVVAAKHLQLDQRVAIKFLLPEALRDAQIVARFAREARAAAKIQSEHVARVIDVGELEGGGPYIVMEYLEGRDLGQLLEERQKLTVDEAVGYLLEACEALAEAHAAGIVHRDLKPSNLFLAKRPTGVPIVKVLDFGISKTNDGENGTQSKLTSTRMVMGTPMYMSPDQIRSTRDVDARSDIWALGVILYECVTGVMPFAAESPAAIIAAIAAEAVRPPRSVIPELPAELERVILKCLEKDRNVRYQNVGELARDLSPLCRRKREAVSRIFTALHGKAPSDAPSANADDGSDDVIALGKSGTVAMVPPRDASGDGKGTGAPKPEQSTRASWGVSESIPIPTTSSKRLPIVIGAVAAVAIIGTIGGVAALKRGNAPSGNTATTTTAAPVETPAPPKAVIESPAPSIPALAQDAVDAGVSPSKTTQATVVPQTRPIAAAIPKPNTPAGKPSASPAQTEKEKSLHMGLK